MSTILDSLKKSSDQRDSSNNQSMDNFNFGSQKKSPVKRYMFLLLFIIAFVFGFYYIMKNYFYADDSSENISDMVEHNIGTQDGEDNRNVVSLEDATKPENKLQKPKAEAVKQRIKQIEQQKQAERAQRKEDVTESADKIIPVAEEIAKVDSSKPIKRRERRVQNPDKKLQDLQRRANNKPQEPKKPKTMMKQVQALETGVIKEVASSDYQVPQQQYQYVHQLPFNVRKELPKFKLNVHIFDKDPNSRIAIINGVRFYINDMIEETVLVKDIVQEGVVLDLNGEVFLIPR